MNTYEYALCVEKRSRLQFINLLHYFYHGHDGVQCDKTRKFLHGEAFVVQHEIYRF